MVKKEGGVVRIEGGVVKKCKSVVKTLKTVVKIKCIMRPPPELDAESVDVGLVDGDRNAELSNAK